MSYEILSKIESPADVNALCEEQLSAPCEEIREKLNIVPVKYIEDVWRQVGLLE